MISIKDIKKTVDNSENMFQKYATVGEYIILIIMLLVLAIVFWNMFALLLKAIKKCDDLIKP